MSSKNVRDLRWHILNYGNYRTFLNYYKNNPFYESYYNEVF